MFLADGATIYGLTDQLALDGELLTKKGVRLFIWVSFESGSTNATRYKPPPIALNTCWNGAFTVT